MKKEKDICLYDISNSYIHCVVGISQDGKYIQKESHFPNCFWEGQKNILSSSECVFYYLPLESVCKFSKIARKVQQTQFSQLDCFLY